MHGSWLLFISHLPSQEAAPRMRVWRGLRAAGAAGLRDGVYLLPGRDDLQADLAEHANRVRAAGGSAHVLRCTATDEPEDAAFQALFDRREDYAAWQRDAADLLARIPALDEPRARREEAALRRALDAIAATDFFPGDARGQAEGAMAQLASDVNAHFSKDEPSATNATVAARNRDDYRGKVWATRRNLWVDRVASAWLIRRFIDPEARFLWLDSPAGCPREAVGFDFDGAAFSHAGEWVTFQVLLRAFGLEGDTGLARIGAVVRALDVGGMPVPEAPGVLALIGAARQRCPGDDEFLAAVGRLLDDLHLAFSGEK